MVQGKVRPLARQYDQLAAVNQTFRITRKAYIRHPRKAYPPCTPITPPLGVYGY
jgi:hypothetical protein